MFRSTQLRSVMLIGFALLTFAESDDTETTTTTCCPASSEEVEALFKEFKNVWKDRNTQERELAKEGKVINSNRKVADSSLTRDRNQDPANHAKELKQLQFQAVTTSLIQKYNLTSTQINDCLPTLEFKHEYHRKARSDCMQSSFSGPCDSSYKYRTADGTCNNLENPAWGSFGICFRRLQPPRYVGESGLRLSVAGGPLPGPRDLSLNVHPHLNRPTKHLTHMYMFYGQLLGHDLIQSPRSTTVDNQAIECCGVTAPLHPQCVPIAVGPRDPFYEQFGTTCINLVRSAICPTCKLGPRQQINQMTAFVDASFVYGNNVNETANLRTNDGTGRLRVVRSSFGDLLPTSADPANDRCSFVNTSDLCFLAGDFRVNVHTTLTSLQTIFVREHNRLADGLRQMNPSWNDEIIFQEARRILGAEMQVIAYKEYLPITLGNISMGHFNLWLTKGRSAYKRKTNPSVYNEFSAAAFRFGHSLINSVVKDTNTGKRLLRDDFFQSFVLRTESISPLMVGAIESPAQRLDRHMVPDVTNFLYRIRGQPAGLDLAAMNIQRGRDHGMPTYVDMVAYCSKRQIIVTNFTDLVTNRLMSEANTRLLYQNYRNVNDIDLWTGILSEIPRDGAVVTSTGACIIGKQFQNLKFGDRFYFEHAKQAGSFTFQQIEELKEMSLSKIICMNTDVKELPVNAMIFNSIKNPLITCGTVSGVDLSYWRE